MPDARLHVRPARGDHRAGLGTRGRGVDHPHVARRAFDKGNAGGPDTVSGNTGTDLAEVDPTDGPLAGV